MKVIDDEKEKTQIKFRDLYLEEVYKNIDKHKMDAMRKISMQKYDEV